MEVDDDMTPKETHEYVSSDFYSNLILRADTR